MNITQEQLKRIIKEEMEAVFQENEGDNFGDTDLANAYRELTASLIEFHNKYMHKLFKALKAGWGYEDSDAGGEWGKENWSKEDYDKAPLSYAILPWLSHGDAIAQLLLKISKLHQNFYTEVARSTKIAMDKSQLPINPPEEILKMIQKSQWYFESIRGKRVSDRNSNPISSRLAKHQNKMNKFLQSGEGKGTKYAQKLQKYIKIIERYLSAYDENYTSIRKYGQIIKDKL